MLVIYDEIESPKNPNLFLIIATKVDKCCADGLTWFFKSVIEIDKDKQMLIKTFKNGELEPFRCCHFCGEKHVIMSEDQVKKANQNTK